MLKYYDFSGVSFLVDKRFKCENASENGRPPFCPAGVALNEQKVSDTIYSSLQYRYIQ
jgi:hypothetical protein